MTNSASSNLLFNFPSKDIALSKDDGFETGPKLLISGKLQNEEEIPAFEEDYQEEDIEETEETKFESSDSSNLPPHKSSVEQRPEAAYHFIEHTVGLDDNLFGIALTYSINPGVIKRDNDVGDEVYPGMVLKIRVRDEVPPESAGPSEENLGKSSFYSQETPEKATQSAVKTRIRAKTDSPNKILPALRIEKLVVYYSTNIGDVEGQLHVEGLQLIFVPTEFVRSPMKRRKDGSPELRFLEEQRYRLNEWRVEINIEDIAECNVVVLPSASCEEHFDLNNEYEKDYLLQFKFYTHGQRSMGKYLDDVFTDMQEKKVPYACAYFKVKNLIDQNHEYTNKQKTAMVQQLQAKIKTTKKTMEESNTKAETQTQLPYFEFIFEKFQKIDADLLRKITKKENSPLKKKEFFGLLDQAESPTEDQQRERPLGNIIPMITPKKLNYRILDESQILNEDQLIALIESTPRLYQTLEWQLLYSTAVHGTSYAHMLRRTQENSPLLIVIKDSNDFVFGAYSTNDLWFSEDFYGGGETFLYTFRDLDEITTFNWSKKNSLFLFVSEEGFMFGGGPHYGLWVSNELTRGRSFECDTFDNKLLSYQTDFEIMKLEVWSIIDPYTGPKQPRKASFSVSENE